MTRIGTWNLAGRWDTRHADLLASLDCDVLLLTEVNERVALSSYSLHFSAARMAQRRRWAAVATRAPHDPRPDPHPASAMVVSEGWTLCSSILPWRGCGGSAPWRGDRHADWTRAAVDELLGNLPREKLVWGGDWNHALSGRELAGSVAGRGHVLAAVAALGLVVPTAQLPHRIAPWLAIDHVAVPTGTPARAAAVVATADGKRLSDHDAYVVTLG